MTYLLRDTAFGRLYQFVLGIAAMLLSTLAAALWTRAIKSRWLKVLPTRLLQKHHILFGGLSLAISIAHTGPRLPGSLCSWLLMSVLLLIVSTGVAAWFVKKRLYDAGKYVEESLNAKPDASGAKPALSPRKAKAAEGGRFIVETPGKQLLVHRALTLTFLVLLAWHIFYHLYH